MRERIGRIVGGFALLVIAAFFVESGPVAMAASAVAERQLLIEATLAVLSAVGAGRLAGFLVHLIRPRETDAIGARLKAAYRQVIDQYLAIEGGVQR